MSFRSIVSDVRESLGTISRRSFEVTVARIHGLKGAHKARASNPWDYVNDSGGGSVDIAVPESRWVGLPPELLFDVIRRLEESEALWPNRKHVVACASVCRSWRQMCKDIVVCPEHSGKLTFPVSLKQPGHRDSMIQCFIKRDKSKSTYRLYLCLSSAVLVENGKFLLSAKRRRRAAFTEYVISMDSENISSSGSTYIGKLRSNFIGTRFVIYDTQPPPNSSVAVVPAPGRSRRFGSTKVAPSKVPSGSYNIAQVTYELNVLGTRGPRRMHCIMHNIPASSLEPGGVVPGQPEDLRSHPLEESFRSMVSLSKSTVGLSSELGTSARLPNLAMEEVGDEVLAKDGPLVLRNKPPRWHEQLQCWCLNFRGRVTIASVKNFQLIAAASQSAGPSEQGGQDKIILQFGKVAKDMFTMDYRYPLSAFQAFAICLSSFDTKLACE